MWYFKKYEYVIGYEILNTKINTFFLKISRTQAVTTLGYTRVALRLKNIAHLAFNESRIKLPITNIMLLYIYELWLTL